MEEPKNVQSTVLIRIAKLGYILLSAVLCTLGIIRIAVPEFPAERFSVLCGGVLIVFGCVRLLGYYSKDLYRLAFQYDFEFGILIIVLGVLTLIRPGSFTSMTCMLLGIMVLADALFKIRITLDARKFGIEKWWVLLIIAVTASVLCGVLVLRFGSGMYVALGITLIAEGVLSLSAAVALVKVVRNQIKE